MAEVWAGVDEAGRGPVVGPLVMAWVQVDTARVSELVALGVRDSKCLSRAQRERLFPRIIRECLQWDVVCLLPIALDRFSIARLQLTTLIEWVRLYRPDRVTVDALGPRNAIPRWLRDIRTAIPDWRGVCRMFPGADREDPVVAAASILAKVIRDRAIVWLRERYGDFGWGYPSERKTRQFLQEWYRQHGRWPVWVRQKWRTCRKVI